MTVFSHALVSLTLVQTMGLSGRELMTAVAFGNLIDFDHLWMFAKQGIYEEVEGKRKYRKRAHTLIHEPIFALPITAISWWFGSIIPLVFWGQHMVADHVFLKSEKRPFWPVSKNWRTYGWFGLGSRAEWVIDATLIAILMLMWIR